MPNQNQILSTLRAYKEKYVKQSSVDYFLDTSAGQEKLDSLCMLYHGYRIVSHILGK